MSKLDIINAEILRREEALKSIEDGEIKLVETIEQFNKLDEFYRDQEKDARDDLECTYLENRHFTGEWPIVYAFAEVEKYPFFDQTDALCNPYFPITKVQDETFDGLGPLEATTARTGAHQRQRTFAATEDIPRDSALTQLQNFPDISNEPLPANWPAAQGFECNGGVGADETACLLDGGTWDPIPDPVWTGADTAPALLRVPLQAWRDDMAAIQADLCEVGTTEYDYWQGLLDDADTVLAAITTDAVFVRNTGNGDPATWGQTQAFTGATETARANLETAADTGVLAHIATRQAVLDGNGVVDEKIFFGLIKLRLHQANGSYSKAMSAKKLQDTQESLKADNISAIELLNLMKVKNS